MREDFQNDLYDTLKDIGEEAEKDIKERINTAGTMTNPQGRYETWAMQRSVSHNVVVTENFGRVRFGWPDGGPAYVAMQDLGTRSLYRKQGVDPFNKPGPGIPGMFAVLDAFVKARENARDRGIG